MNSRTYFPLGKAEGDAFCNREAETQWLLSNIEAVKHSLLIAPRRFGKSSLAEKAIEQSELAVVILNFNTCVDEQEVEALIRQGVSKLISEALGPVDKIINTFKRYTHNLIPKLSFGNKYAHLELALNKQQETPASYVEESLTLMEKLLADKKRKAILVFDEFQMVGLIAKGKGVEAAIRNAAQDMKYLTIIFSGSNRSLLKAVFENENRPLYKLCRKLHLKRIEATHYQKHINRIARILWKTELSEAAFNKIMLLSQRHPYYVNYLCDVICTQAATLPTLQDVENAWLTVIEEESSDANAEIAQLSMGQKKILKHIANHKGENLMSAETATTISMALSSISGALSALVEKDIIEKGDDGYHIINPIIQHILRS